MMNVSQINTTVMKTLYASILLEDTTASASQAIPGMELHAKVKILVLIPLPLGMMQFVSPSLHPFSSLLPTFWVLPTAIENFKV